MIMSFLQVTEALKDLPAGSVFFRPALKPSVAAQLCHLAMSIKLAQLPTGPWVMNVDVKEGADKPPRMVRVEE